MANDATSAHVPAGWYPDPQRPEWRRYWDGTNWTDQVATPVPGAEEPTTAIEPPRRGRGVAIALTVLVLAAGAGVGAYFVGRSTGEDLEAARAAGAAAGREAGAAKGRKVGYAEGFEAGREQGYRQTYAESYKAAYRKAFEDAGLAVPEKVSVPEEP
jgi:flagellar biosynthesis/type III secretory pathway protein FliH